MAHGQKKKKKKSFLGKKACTSYVWVWDKKKKKK